MSWFGSGAVNVEGLVKEACSDAIPDGDIDYNKAFEIIDLIKVKKIKGREFLKVWENKIINNKNPNSQISLLNLVDLCIKNAGINFSLELFAGGSIANADNDFSTSYGTIRNQFLNKLLFILHNSKTNKAVKDKILELIETWHILFAQNSNLNHNINLIYNTLKDEKFVFPKIDNKIIFNEKFLESKVPPVWVDSDSCMIGFEPFTMLNRKHHCRNCGGVFCQLHCAKSAAIPMMGLNEPVRVCDSCYEQLTEKARTSLAAKKGKSRLSVHRAAKSGYESDEDEMLKKALALSLQDSQQNGPYVAPEEYGDKNFAANGATAAPENEDEEDEQVKAAIAASLRDMEDQKSKNGQAPEGVQNNYQTIGQFNPPAYVPQDVNQNNQYQGQQEPSPFEPLLNHELESRISPREEDSIYLFSQLMSNLKQQQMNGQQSPDQILQSQELQGLYTEIIKLKTKLGRNINEDLGKYDQFIDLQQKLGTVVRLYDELLEKRLSLRGYNRNSYSSGPYAPSQQPQPPSPSQFYNPQLTPSYSGIANNYTGSVQPNYTGYQYPPSSAQNIGTNPTQESQLQAYPPVQQTPQQSISPQFVHDPYAEAQQVSSEPTGQPITNADTAQQMGQPSAPPEVDQLQESAPPVPSEPTGPVPQQSQQQQFQQQPQQQPSQPFEQQPQQQPSEPPRVGAYQCPPQPSQVISQQTSGNYQEFSNMFPHAPTAAISEPQKQPKEEPVLIEL